MTATHVPMQKKCARAPGFPSFDTVRRHAYAMSYVVPVHQGLGVLLSPDAGVWVGISKRNSSHPPGQRGWVLFSSAISLRSRTGPVFRVLESSNIRMYKENFNYDDCDRKRNLCRAENQ